MTTFGIKDKLKHDPAKCPANVPLDMTGIPDLFRDSPRWVEFRFKWKTDETNPDKSKWDKPPFIARMGDRRGKGAGSNRPHDWSTFDEAMDCVQQTQALGEKAYPGFIVGQLGNGRTIAVIDLDDVRDPDTGEIKPWALSVVRYLDSYTEVSATGTGIHVFALGTLPPGDRKKEPVEMYDEKRGVLITGHRLDGTPAQVEDRQEQLNQIHAAAFPPKAPSSSPALVEPSKTPVMAESSDRVKFAPNPAYAYLTDEEAIGKLVAEKKNGKTWALAFTDPATFRLIKGNNSKADMAIALKLAGYVGGDPDRIEQIMRAQAGLYREKWDRPTAKQTWLRYAIDRALKKWNGWVYTGKKPTKVKAAKIKAEAEAEANDEWEMKGGNDFVTEPIEWLMRGSFPFKKVAITEGDGEAGKSAVVCDVVAAATTGRPMPCGTRHDPLTVLWFQGEDDFGDTTKPRIEAAGGDVSRIKVINFDPKKPPPLTDPDQLARVIRKSGARVVVVEVLALALGVDNNRTYEVAKRLAPVVDVAQATGAAIICIRQLGKGTRRDVSMAGNGTVMIGAMARSVAMVKAGIDGDQDLRAFGPTKGNLCKPGEKTAYLFRLVDSQDGREVPVVHWIGQDPLRRTMKEIASDLLEPERRPVGRPQSESRVAADKLLRDMVGQEMVTGVCVQEVVKQTGISRATAYRVLKEAMSTQAQG